MEIDELDTGWDDFDMEDSKPNNEMVFELSDEELKIAEEQAKSSYFLEKLCQELNILVELCETLKNEANNTPIEKWKYLSKDLISITNNCMG
ncbi:hypothetical protein GF376_03105, partial [Candidatus Peregrinibacteria bacterium]|nr:hypothetical protein [Candidatus Peregrinibacteria bacterium]